MLIGQINRWLIAGAVVLTGAISVAAARSFHGHNSSSRASAVTQSSGGQSSSSTSGNSSSGGSLQQPAQAPSASGQSSPAPVVSGGS